MVRWLAFVTALAFSVPAVAAETPSPPEAGTIAQHNEWSRKFVHEPDTADSRADGALTTGSLAGTLSDASDTDRQKCTPGTRVFDRLPFGSWQLRPSC
jgi:hypothetical protein